MPGTTGQGYPYPVPADPIGDAPTKIQALAQAVDDQLGTLYSGQQTASFSSASTTTVTFSPPAGRFTSAPACVAMTRNQGYYCNLVSTSTTSVVVRVSRVDGTSVTASVVVDLIATQQ